MELKLLSSSEWEDFLRDFPDHHIFQTSSWGELKSSFGWEAFHVVLDSEISGRLGAQILLRKLPFGFKFAYIPKGPISSVSEPDEIFLLDEFWGEIDKFCLQNKAIFLKLEPDLWEKNRRSGDQEISTKPVSHFSSITEIQNGGVNKISPSGFVFSFQNIQPRQTILISLNGDEDRLLARMKQKTRYNIRLALKKGVIVKQCTNISLFYSLMRQTHQRDRFEIHSLEYYQKAYDLFFPRGMCVLFIAEYHNEPIAGIMVFASGKRAWYFYGASSDNQRDKMPNYLLQWEAMRWARSMGCVEYDLWGIPDFPIDKLESEFNQQEGELWGVYRFKRGFGGKVYRSVCSLDRIYHKPLYKLSRMLVR